VALVVTTVSTLHSTYDDPAAGAGAIARDRTHALLGQVMGYVAVTVGFAALGAYLEGVVVPGSGRKP
jgi:hypothetical protein